MICRQYFIRLAFLSLAFLASNLATGQAAKSTATNRVDSLRWIDARDLVVEGKGWNDTKAFYDRLPAKADGKVPRPVWNLSHNSSGMHLRFITDATNITARWAVTSSTIALPHMSAT